MQRNSTLWAYIDSLDLLPNGSKDDIKRAKAEYRRQYLKNYKKAKRKKGLEVVITLSEQERAKLEKEAGKHQLKLPAFIRKSSLAYLSQAYLVIDRLRVAHIEQLLAECAREIQEIGKSDKKWFRSFEWKYEALEKKIESLENNITQTLRQPKTLAEVVEQIKEDQALYNSLLILINDTENKIPKNTEFQATS